ncbi:hypothetical protein CG51_00540 [Haematobacter missouriensis]|nr:hypothetical protein CG51_00540 [Haematobacter missouriensis]
MFRHTPESDAHQPPAEREPQPGIGQPRQHMRPDQQVRPPGREPQDRRRRAYQHRDIEISGQTRILRLPTHLKHRLEEAGAQQRGQQAGERHHRPERGGQEQIGRSRPHEPRDKRNCQTKRHETAQHFPLLRRGCGGQQRAKRCRCSQIGEGPHDGQEPHAKRVGPHIGQAHHMAGRDQDACAARNIQEPAQSLGGEVAAILAGLAAHTASARPAFCMRPPGTAGPPIHASPSRTRSNRCT